MLTMTRLPPDSFLPSGAMLDPNERSMSIISQLNNHSSTTSVISPLSLPHALENLSYLDESHLTNLPPPNYSHSPSVSVPPRPQERYLSPRPSSPSVCEQKPSSLSPTRFQTRSRVTSPSVAPASNLGVASPLDSMTSRSVASLLRRREDQSRRLIENWHAERAHLEASRARAEEVYQEERAIMDEERMIWIEERNKLEKDVSKWRKRAETAERQRDRMAEMVKRVKRTGADPSKCSDGAADLTVGSIRGGGPGSSGSQSQSTSKALSPSDVPSPGTLPNTLRGVTMPESKPFIPLDPRMQGGSPSVGSPKTQQDRIPSIDIQEVMPELEGIRVRPDAVQKSTFTDEKASSPSLAPRKVSPSAIKHDPLRSRAAPTELTKEALKAPESDRLTMHAGHTPNHSMSLSRLHTVDSTEAPNTVDSSGAPTPKYQPPESTESKATESKALEQALQGAAKDLGDALEDLDSSRAQNPPDAPRLRQAIAVFRGEPDPKLKRPLNLRNIPALDEPFLKALSNKLEFVRSNDTTPTVLKKDPFDREWTPSDDKDAPKAGGDGAGDARDEPAEGGEEDVPLKFKKSSNFGAPLGELGKPSGS